MHKAAARGDTAALLVKVLLDVGANIYATESGGNTPARLAAAAGSLRIPRLLASGFSAMYESKNATGFTPLMMAARAAKLDVKRHLLEKGVNHAVSDASGTSLVHLAIRRGNPAVMQVLQDFGANYNNVTAIVDNAHPIWQAIHEGQLAFVERMLDSGLSVDYEYGAVSLLQLAAEVDNPSIVRLLLDRGAAVNKADNYGWTALIPLPILAALRSLYWFFKTATRRPAIIRAGRC